LPRHLRTFSRLSAFLSIPTRTRHVETLARTGKKMSREEESSGALQMLDAGCAGAHPQKALPQRQAASANAIDSVAHRVIYGAAVQRLRRIRTRPYLSRRPVVDARRLLCGVRDRGLSQSIRDKKARATSGDEAALRFHMRAGDTRSARAAIRLLKRPGCRPSERQPKPGARER
jgi:hypothetical protein